MTIVIIALLTFYVGVMGLVLNAMSNENDRLREENKELRKQLEETKHEH